MDWADAVDGEQDIAQEDAWAVIVAYFTEKGLVRQQLDSFDEFIQNTMQELVDDSRSIRISPESQYNPGQKKTDTMFQISFGRLYLGKPIAREADGSTSYLYPHEARLRNLTYSAPLYVDVTLEKFHLGSFDDQEPFDRSLINQELIGYVPIMLRSSFCQVRRLLRVPSLCFGRFNMFFTPFLCCRRLRLLVLLLCSFMGRLTRS